MPLELLTWYLEDRNLLKLRGLDSFSSIFWGPLHRKLGRPKNAKFNHDGSDPPFAPLWGVTNRVCESFLAWISCRLRGPQGGPRTEFQTTRKFENPTFTSKIGPPSVLPAQALNLGKSKGGLTNGGLSPKFSEKIGGKSFPENRAFSGQIGAISGLVRAFSGPIGTNSSAPHSHGGRAEIAPKGPFLARLAPFGLSPPLLSPRLDFPDK